MDGTPIFEILERIGHGEFSTVYKARWINGPPSWPEEPSRSSLAQRSNSLGSTYSALNYSGVTPTTPLVPMGDMNLQQGHSVPAIATTSAAATVACSQQLANDHLKPIKSNGTSSSFNQNQLPNQNARAVFMRSSSLNGGRGNEESKTTKDKYVALKRIKFCEIQNSKMRMDCVKEVRLLQQLKHPNIINYSISFMERNELIIVLELADGGDLSKLIRYFQKRNQLLTERTILKYFSQVCSAIQYIHSKRILHRDIKPANIFMTSNGCVKLGDFGLGRFFSQNTRDAHSIVGTFYYMSPERIRESGYGFSSDIWSLGCVLYELITLNSPFSILFLNQSFKLADERKGSPSGPNQQPGNNFTQPINTAQQQPQQYNPNNLQWLIDRIVRAEYPSLAPYTNISPRLRHLAAECLNPNPEGRPNMDYLCAVVNEAFWLQQLSSNTNTNSSAPKTSDAGQTSPLHPMNLKT